jgi:uncharacterized membrane protein
MVFLFLFFFVFGRGFFLSHIEELLLLLLLLLVLQESSSGLLDIDQLPVVSVSPWN